MATFKCIEELVERKLESYVINYQLKLEPDNKLGYYSKNNQDKSPGIFFSIRVGKQNYDTKGITGVNDTTKDLKDAGATLLYVYLTLPLGSCKRKWILKNECGFS